MDNVINSYSDVFVKQCNELFQFFNKCERLAKKLYVNKCKELDYNFSDGDLYNHSDHLDLIMDFKRYFFTVAGNIIIDLNGNTYTLYECNSYYMIEEIKKECIHALYSVAGASTDDIEAYINVN